MAEGSKTTRGLRRIPAYTPPEDERERPRPTHEERMRRRKIKHSLFSLGYGLDMPLFVFVVVLLAVGLVMLYSASYADSYYNEGSSYYYIQRQGLFAIVGFVAMLFVSTFDYHRFHGLALLIYAVAIILLGAVLIFGRLLHMESIAPSEGVAYRWLNLGVQFQPSEVAKFAVITLCAHYISQHIDQMGTLRYGVLPFLLIVGLPAGLVFLENHLSGTIIILALGVILMFVGGTKLRYFLIGGGALIALLALYVVMKGSYQMDRVSVWLDPFSETLDRDLTWQTRQSLYAIGSGGFLGVGLGQSRQKYLYLPKPMNDFIFAIICEELGMIGALVVIILFSLLIWRGMYISLHAKDKFGTLLGLGITFQVGLQAVLNICVVTNTIPNTGISLPFFSYGGTALLMLLGEMGILLNISRSANVEKT